MQHWAKTFSFEDGVKFTGDGGDGRKVHGLSSFGGANASPGMVGGLVPHARGGVVADGSGSGGSAAAAKEERTPLLPQRGAGAPVPAGPYDPRTGDGSEAGRCCCCCCCCCPRCGDVRPPPCFGSLLAGVLSNVTRPLLWQRHPVDLGALEALASADALRGGQGGYDSLVCSPPTRR